MLAVRRACCNAAFLGKWNEENMERPTPKGFARHGRRGDQDGQASRRPQPTSTVNGLRRGEHAMVERIKHQTSYIKLRLGGTSANNVWHRERPCSWDRRFRSLAL